YVFVGDVARSVWLAATKPLPEKGRMDARAFNIGTGGGTSVIDIENKLQKAGGSKVPVESAPHRPGEQQESFVNVEKAKQLLGWTPQVGLEDALSRPYRWPAARLRGAPP